MAKIAGLPLGMASASESRPLQRQMQASTPPVAMLILVQDKPTYLVISVGCRVSLPWSLRLPVSTAYVQGARNVSFQSGEAREASSSWYWVVR